MQDSRNVRKQGNMTPPKEHNNFLVTDSKEMESCELSEKEFKGIVLRKLSKIQWTQKNNAWKKWEVQQQDRMH